MAFAVVKDPAQLADETLRASLAKEVIATVSKELGAIANPSQVHFVTQLPKTRSGKVLRRSIQAIAEGRSGRFDHAGRSERPGAGQTGGHRPVLTRAV